MFKVSKFININVFLISLALGIFIMYVLMPDTRKIYVYPSPENVEILQYRDRTGHCFKFDQKQVPCPTNKSLISQIPIQH
jgi:hypothetical protein